MNYGIDFDSFYQTDVLFIMKDGKKTDIYEEFPYMLTQYDRNTGKTFRKDPPYTLNLEHYEPLIFDGKSTLVLTSMREKIEYAYASLHEDTIITDTIKKLIPGIDKVIITSARCTMKPYLKHWMEKYGFTLEEFLTDTRYVVVSSSYYNHIIDQLIDLEILDENSFEHCSLEEATE